MAKNRIAVTLTVLLCVIGCAITLYADVSLNRDTRAWYCAVIYTVAQAAGTWSNSNNSCWKSDLVSGGGNSVCSRQATDSAGYQSCVNTAPYTSSGKICTTKSCPLSSVNVDNSCSYFTSTEWADAESCTSYGGEGDSCA